MGIGKDRAQFVVHGVGLELDEFPVFTEGFFIKFEKDMTFAIEPKFIFQAGAVSIENSFVLRENGVGKADIV